MYEGVYTVYPRLRQQGGIQGEKERVTLGQEPDGHTVLPVLAINGLSHLGNVSRVRQVTTDVDELCCAPLDLTGDGAYRSVKIFGNLMQRAVALQQCLDTCPFAKGEMRVTVETVGTLS
jgi:hypothetical protein